MLPAEGITAFVLGTGPDLPRDRLYRLEGYFTIGVNRIWRFGFTPTVWFRIDNMATLGRPVEFNPPLTVCDQSVQVSDDELALPMRAGPLPQCLNPNRLYHLPNAGAVAALWAISLGCYPVVLLGMGCQPDGRLESQLHAMRQALSQVKAMDYKPRGAYFPTVWQWSDDPIEFDEHMRNYYVRPTDTEQVVRRLREFYA